jgi:hypothetical protein
MKKLSVISGFRRDVDEICRHFVKGYDETSTGICSLLCVISQKSADLEQQGDQDMYNIAGTDVLFLVIVVDFVLINDPESVRTAVEWQPCSCCHSNQTR